MGIQFDIDGLRRLLESYHNITGVKIAVVFPDAGLPPVSVGGDCAFCRLVKRDGRFLSRCIENDAAAFRRAMQGETCIYRCHAGLYESVAPILYDDRPIACLMIGQIAPTVPAAQAGEMIAACLPGHSAPDELLTALLAMPPRSDEYLASSVRIMTACAGYIHLHNMIAPARSPLSARFLRYIEAHYAEPITLQEMAAALGVCVTKLCTAVRAELGSSPHALLDACRIEQAKAWLTGTALPIHTVAARVGIADYNYFSRKFKQTVGVTPTEYRKQNERGGTF